jgi:hypothetical protein
VLFVGFDLLQLVGDSFFGIMLFRSLAVSCGLLGSVLGHPFSGPANEISDSLNITDAEGVQKRGMRWTLEV